MDLPPKTFAVGWSAVFTHIPPKQAGKLFWATTRKYVGLDSGCGTTLSSEVSRAIGKHSSTGVRSVRDLENICNFIELLALSACASNMDAAGFGRRLKRQLGRASEWIDASILDDEDLANKSVEVIVAAVEQVQQEIGAASEDMSIHLSVPQCTFSSVGEPSIVAHVTRATQSNSETTTKIVACGTSVNHSTHRALYVEMPIHVQDISATL